MILPPGAQRLADELRAILGIPPYATIILNIDPDGICRSVDVKITYRPVKDIDSVRPEGGK